MEILAHSKASDKSFSPDQLQTLRLRVAGLALGNHTLSAEHAIADALCEVETWLRSVLDPRAAAAAIQAHYSAVDGLCAARAEQEPWEVA